MPAREFSVNPLCHVVGSRVAAPSFVPPLPEDVLPLTHSPRRAVASGSSTPGCPLHGFWASLNGGVVSAAIPALTNGGVVLAVVPCGTLRLLSHSVGATDDWTLLLNCSSGGAPAGVVAGSSSWTPAACEPRNSSCRNFLHNLRALSVAAFHALPVRILSAEPYSSTTVMFTLERSFDLDTCIIDLGLKKNSLGQVLLWPIST